MLCLGIADHLGWAIAVTANDDHDVVDRRRIELVEPGVPAMPIHGAESSTLDDDETAALVEEVRASIARAAADAFDQLETDLPEPIASISLRDWPADFPTDIETQRKSPWEARADAIMYRQVLADFARARGIEVHFYDAKEVVAIAVDIIGDPDEANQILQGPRRTLGPPWSKDHRIALASTIEASRAAQM